MVDGRGEDQLDNRRLRSCRGSGDGRRDGLALLVKFHIGDANQPMVCPAALEEGYWCVTEIRRCYYFLRTWCGGLCGIDVKRVRHRQHRTKSADAAAEYR